MKTRFINIRGAASKAFVCSLALLALLAFVLPQAAQASTAANTVIRNTATVNYNDTAGNAMAAQSSTVDITVSQVCGSAVLSAPTDITTAPGTPAVYNYTITGGGNGEDTYALSAAETARSAGIGVSGIAVAPASVTLGATTVAAGTTILAAGTTAISVPNDGSGGNTINGIAAGETIVIGSAVYTVASIADNGTPVNGFSTITVNGNGTAQAITAGTLINEQRTFTVTVTPGTLSPTATTDQTHTVLATADGAYGTCANTTDETITTVTVPRLSITKEVSSDGSTWGATGSFAPGATVYYRVTVTNNGTSNATVVTITDALPQYTTYVANSTLLNGKTVAGDGATLPLIAGLLVDDDNPVRTAGNAATGIIHPASSAVVIFRVTVN